MTERKRVPAVQKKYVAGSQSAISSQSAAGNRPVVGNQSATVPASGQRRFVCPSCGGNVAADEPRCPYCGTLNPVGAEHEYLEELEDIKDDTNELADDAQEGFENNLRSNTKWIVTLIVAIVALTGLGIFAYNCSSTTDEKREVQSYQERESFREQYFAELDRLWEEGDDAALSEYAWSLIDKPGSDALYSWRHQAYLQTYHDWEDLGFAQIAIDEGSAGIDDYTWGTAAALRLACLDESGRSYKSQLSAEEEQRVSEYRTAAREFLSSTLRMTDEQIQDFAVSVEDEHGYVQTDKLRKRLRSLLEEL